MIYKGYIKGVKAKKNDVILIPHLHYNFLLTSQFYGVERLPTYIDFLNYTFFRELH